MRFGRELDLRCFQHLTLRSRNHVAEVLERKITESAAAVNESMFSMFNKLLVGEFQVGALYLLMACAAPGW